MTWNDKQAILKRLGLNGFDTEEEFENWMQWENDDKQLEKRIKTALNGSQFFKPEKRTYAGSGSVYKRELYNEECR